MARKKMTFADQAKKIMDKYGNRPGDALSKEAMNRELSELKEMQEVARQQKVQEEALKANDAMAALNSLGYGGTLKYSHGGPYHPENPREMQRQLNSLGFNIADDGDWGPESQAAYDQFMAQKQNKNNPMTPMKSLDSPGGVPEKQLVTPEQGQPNMFSILGESYAENPPANTGSYEGQKFNPWIAGAQSVGDVYGLAKSFQPIEERGRLSFDPTDTSEAEKAIDRQTAMGRLNLRAMQRQNPGAALSSQIAGNVGLTGQAAGAQAGLIQDAANRDILRKQQIDQFNLGQAEQDRASRDAQLMARVGHMQNLGQTVAGAYGDYRKQKNQDAIINMMGEGNYRWVTDENGNPTVVPNIG